MSTVADPTVIDQVAIDQTTGRVVLFIQVPLTWSDGGADQLEQLVAKVNAYMAYIQSGQYRQIVPDGSDPGADIGVVCIDEPSGDSAKLLDQLRDLLGARGIRVVVQAAFPNDMPPEEVEAKLAEGMRQAGLAD